MITILVVVGITLALVTIGFGPNTYSKQLNNKTILNHFSYAHSVHSMSYLMWPAVIYIDSKQKYSGCKEVACMAMENNSTSS